MAQLLPERIEKAIQQRPDRITSLHGGMIGDVFRLDFKDKPSLVAKVANEPQAKLTIEGFMLRYLAQNSQLPVPSVVYCEPTLLIITFIEGSSTLDNRSQEHAAELLAALHSIHNPRYGFPQDTLIGSLGQPNPWEESWVVFFRDHRLLHMGRAAVREGAIALSLMKRLEKFCDHIDQWILEPEQASLIHGDMWTTNILTKDGRVTGFVDPAAYYAHPEIELAYSTLFSTFGPAFFHRYHELRPITPGFMELRRDLYNLYPLLVHVRLFGGNYESSVDRILRNIGF